MERVSSTNVGALTLRRVIEDSQNPGGVNGAIQFNDATDFGGFGGWDGSVADIPAINIGDPGQRVFGGASAAAAIGADGTGSDWALAIYAAGDDPSTELPLGIYIAPGLVSYSVGQDGNNLQFNANDLDDVVPEAAYWSLELTPVGGAALGVEAANAKAYGASSPLAAVAEVMLFYDLAYAAFQLIDTHLIGLYGSDDQATPADLLVSGLAGVGTGYVCADANGKLVRSAIACV